MGLGMGLLGVRVEVRDLGSEYRWHADDAAAAPADVNARSSIRLAQQLTW